MPHLARSASGQHGRSGLDGAKRLNIALGLKSNAKFAEVSKDFYKQ